MRIIQVLRILLKPWVIMSILLLIFFFMFLRSGALEREQEEYKENGVTKHRSVYSLHLEKFGNYLLDTFK